jgi:hypothetical protein
VAEALEVTEALGVAVPVNVGLEVRVWVPVGDGLMDGVGDAVSLGLAVAAGVGVAEGPGVGVWAAGTIKAQVTLSLCCVEAWSLNFTVTVCRPGDRAVAGLKLMLPLAAL